MSLAGAFVLNPEFYKDKSGNILLEICAHDRFLPTGMLTIARGIAYAACHHYLACAAGKEYAKADSRYATRDACVVGIEALAMLMGPLSFLCIYGIATRRPWRHTLQMLVSMGQLYGDVLYFMSAHFEGAAQLCWQPSTGCYMCQDLL